MSGEPDEFWDRRFLLLREPLPLPRIKPMHGDDPFDPVIQPWWVRWERMTGKPVPGELKAYKWHSRSPRKLYGGAADRSRQARMRRQLEANREKGNGTSKMAESG